MRPSPRCAVCCVSDGLVGIVVGSEQIHLCEDHARRLDGHQPESYADLAKLYAMPGLNRRKRADRRQHRRRAFPPRPEGRRLNSGRRRDDRSR